MGNNTSSHPSHPNSPRTHGSASPSGSGSNSTISPTSPTSASGSTSNRHRALSLSHLVPSASQPISSSSSSSPHVPSTPPLLVSGGHLSPQGPSPNAIVSAEGKEGVVPGTPGGGGGYNVLIVKSFILDKKLAPFYRGLDDYEETWEDDEVAQVLRKSRETNKVGVVDPNELKESPSSAGGGSMSGRFGGFASARHQATIQAAVATIPQNERELREARAYRGAVECPICFLYYPPNINTSRCCQQPICTDCFVQMKRSEPTLQHLESEPACCPFCVEADFGVIYEIGKIVPQDESLPIVSSLSSEMSAQDPRPIGETMRRKSVSHKSKEVVTVDQIRPDWEDKLNAVKAQAARRASRRIIMQRVGDRLIPVGYTSSRNAAANNGDLGPILTSAEEEALASATRAGRRSGRRGGSASDAAGVPPGDLEELMIMEAMRLSMIDHEEHQRKEAEAKKKQEEQVKKAAAAAAAVNNGEGSSTGSKLSNVLGFAKHHATGSGSSTRGHDSVSGESSPSVTPKSGSRRSSTPAEASAMTSTPNPPVTTSSSNETRPSLINLESTETILVAETVRNPGSKMSTPPRHPPQTPTSAGYARLQDDD